jgi:hypothetical protein
LDWERLDEDNAAHIAALAYQLAPSSRTRAALSPAASHGLTVELLRRIELNQRTWHWANTENAKDETSRPQQITLPGEEEAHERLVERETKNAQDVALAFGMSI